MNGVVREGIIARIPPQTLVSILHLLTLAELCNFARVGKSYRRTSQKALRSLRYAQFDSRKFEDLIEILPEQCMFLEGVNIDCRFASKGVRFRLCGFYDVHFFSISHCKQYTCAVSHRGPLLCVCLPVVERKLEDLLESLKTLLRSCPSKCMFLEGVSEHLRCRYLVFTVGIFFSLKCVCGGHHGFALCASAFGESPRICLKFLRCVFPGERE